MKTRHAACSLVVSAILMLLLPVLFGQEAAANLVAGSQMMSNGQTVAWSDYWQFAENGSSGSVSDVVALTNTWKDSAGYVIGEPDVAGDVLLGRISTGVAGQGVIQPVESGNRGQTLYAFDKYVYSDEIAGALFTVTLDGSLPTLSFVIATSTRFAEAVELAQAGITVDGAALFDGFDGPSLQARLLDQNGEARQERIAAGGLPNAFLLAPNGIEVRLGDEWGLVRGSCTIIELNTMGPPPAFMTVQSGDPGGLGGSADIVSTMLEVSSGGRVMRAVDAPNGNVVVLLGDTGPNGPIYILYEEMYLPDSSVSVLLSAAPDDLPAALALAQGTITINGVPALQGVEELIPALAAGGS